MGFYTICNIPKYTLVELYMLYVEVCIMWGLMRDLIAIFYSSLWVLLGIIINYVGQKLKEQVLCV